MTAITPVQVVQGLLLCLLLAWKGTHLARAPRSVPLRCVVACLAFATVAFLAQLPNASLVSPASPWRVFTQFALILATSTALDFFFLFSALGTAGARRLAVRRAAVMAAVVAVMAAATALVPPGASIRDQSVPAVAVLYLLFMAANGILLADALGWTLRGVAGAGRVLARGLRITSAGLALLIAALVPMIVRDVLRLARLPAPPALLTAGILLAVPGIVLFLIGVAYPGTVSRLTAVRVYARHWRLYRQLAPLWHELHRAYPQDALARVPAAASWRDALSLREVHRRFYRRVVECRDGLVRLSPHLAPGTPQQEAERLLDALRTIPAARKAPGQKEKGGHAVPVAVPAGPGLDADAAALAALSRQIPAARRAQAASPQRQENP